MLLTDTVSNKQVEKELVVNLRVFSTDDSWDIRSFVVKSFLSPETRAIPSLKSTPAIYSKQENSLLE